MGTTARRLHVAKPNDVPVPVAEPADVPVRPRRPRRKTVAEAAASGSRRDLLIATRDRIARTVTSADCPPRDLAALSRQLVLLAKEIEALDLAEKAEAGRSGQVDDEEFDASAI